MNILFLSRWHSHAHSFSVGRKGTVVALLAALVVVPLVAWYVGYRLGARESASHPVEATWQAEVARQRAEIAEAKRTAQDNLTALAVRLDEMQSHVRRLEALGQRLTRTAKLEKGEFDFSGMPGEVDRSESGVEPPLQVASVMDALDVLSQRLEGQARRLSAPMRSSSEVALAARAGEAPCGKPAAGAGAASTDDVPQINGPMTAPAQRDCLGADPMASAPGLRTQAAD